MLTYVLGAPGSGKTAVAPLLRRVLPACVVLDWDAYMSPASELAGRDVRRDRSMWLGYRRLVRAVIDTIHPAPLVVLGVCTPAELSDWPIDAWILLDCTDAERRRRLASDNEVTDVDDAVADAAHYRALGLRVIDTTNRTPQTVADELARAIREVEA